MFTCSFLQFIFVHQSVICLNINSVFGVSGSRKKGFLRVFLDVPLESLGQEILLLHSEEFFVPFCFWRKCGYLIYRNWCPFFEDSSTLVSLITTLLVSFCALTKKSEPRFLYKKKSSCTPFDKTISHFQ